MKPIEIHIEGYKIVITEDKEEPKINYVPKKEDEDLLKKYGDAWKQPDIINVPYIMPTTTGEWWKYPTVTWTSGNVESSPSEDGIVTKIMKGVEQKLTE